MDTGGGGRGDGENFFKIKKILFLKEKKKTKISWLKLQMLSNRIILASLAQWVSNLLVSGPLYSLKKKIQWQELYSIYCDHVLVEAHKENPPSIYTYI